MIGSVMAEFQRPQTSKRWLKDAIMGLLLHDPLQLLPGLEEDQSRGRRGPVHRDFLGIHEAELDQHQLGLQVHSEPFYWEDETLVFVRCH